MNANKSIMNAPRLMDSQTSSSQSNAQTNRRTSVEKLDVRFKYANGSTPAPSTRHDESIIYSSSVNNDNDPLDDIIRHKLSKRSYHLPGNNFCQDLCMYVRNNHQVFGICCHHKLHPVTIRHRLVILMGSLAFGLTMTNAVYLYLLWGMDDVDHYSDSAISISLGIGGDVVDGIATENTLKIDISHGMAILWTVGAASHSLFDLVLWHMIACAYTERKCCHTVGWNMAVSLVILTVALTTCIAVVRAYDYGLDDIQNSEYIDANGLEKADFRYLYGCLLELAISLFVYTPMMQMVLFSGILGCGVLPVLGGRPYRVREDEKRDSAGDHSTRVDRV